MSFYPESVISAGDAPPLEDDVLASDPTEVVAHHHLQLAERDQLRSGEDSVDVTGRIVELAGVGTRIVDDRSRNRLLLWLLTW
jgi:hypothetical protein